MTTPLKLHTLREGYGNPLVVLHAFPLDHRMWADAAAAMTGNARVIAPDLPGMGQSPAPREEPSIEAAADAVAHALDDAGIRRAVVAGLSMGGYVALALAERHPELVTGLGLVDTRSTPDSPEARENRLRLAEEVVRTQTPQPVMGMVAALLGETTLAEHKDLVPRVEEWIRGQRPAGIAWSERAMASRVDRTAVLEGFTDPVAIIVGEEDTLSRVCDAEHMVVAARHASLARIPAAGHLSAVEQPEAVAEQLSDLVKRAAQ